MDNQKRDSADTMYVFMFAEINECVSNPCQNGTCQDSVNGFTCQCSVGYTGILCDTGRITFYYTQLRPELFST